MNFSSSKEYVANHCSIVFLIGGAGGVAAAVSDDLVAIGPVAGWPVAPVAPAAPAAGFASCVGWPDTAGWSCKLTTCELSNAASPLGIGAGLVFIAADRLIPVKIVFVEAISRVAPLGPALLVVVGRGGCEMGGLSVIEVLDAAGGWLWPQAEVPNINPRVPSVIAFRNLEGPFITVIGLFAANWISFCSLDI
jgi:hypothetical protein